MGNGGCLVEVGREGQDMPTPRHQRGDGDTVIATRTPKGVLITPEKEFIEEFNRVITAEPERTGVPENWPPEKMREILVKGSGYS